MSDVNEVVEPVAPDPSEMDILNEDGEKEPAANPDAVTERADTQVRETEVEDVEEVKEETEEVEESEEDEEDKEVKEALAEEEDVKLSPRDKALADQVAEKFPKVLKEFPQIRSALYRDKEFSKLFVSPEDAKEASERSEILDYIEDSVVDGNAEVLIENIAALDDKAVEKFALNFLPALNKKNSEVYNKVVDPLARNLLYSIYKQGKASGNKNLAAAAQHINLFLFDNKDPSGARLGFEDKVDPERQKFLSEREQSFKSEVTEGSIKEIKAKIGAQIDKSIQGGMREVIIEKTLLGIGKVLNKDESYGRQRDSLFRKAARSGYAGDWRTRIQSLYTGQATKLLPAVLRLVQKELLPTSTNAQTQNPPKKKVNVQGGRTMPAGSKAKSDVMKPGEKDIDFLAR